MGYCFCHSYEARVTSAYFASRWVHRLTVLVLQYNTDLLATTICTVWQGVGISK